MARQWKSRQAPPPTSITEIARRYHAAAVALAQTLGLSVPEVLAQHRESVTAIFIECGKCEIRLPVGIKLPPLAAPLADATNGHAVVAPPERPPVDPAENYAPTEKKPTPGADPELGGAENYAPNDAVPPNGTRVPFPTTIPTDAGLPCAGQAIPALTPAQLAMLISKTARLLQDEGERWVGLLYALEREREGRLAKGRRGQERPAGATGDVP